MNGRRRANSIEIRGHYVVSARFAAVKVTATAAENFVNSLNRIYFRFYAHQMRALLHTTINIFNNHQFTLNREFLSFLVRVAKLYLYVCVFLPSNVWLSDDLSFLLLLRYVVKKGREKERKQFMPRFWI